MRPTLFRQEAIDATRATLAGRVLAAHRLPFAVLSALAAGIAIAIVCWGMWGQYTRKAHVSGYLTPSAGMIKVYAGQAGTLVEKHVHEGQKVTRGDTLFVLSTERGSPETPASQTAAIGAIAQRQSALAREYESHAGIARLQVAGTQQRLRRMEAERRELQSAEAHQRQRVESAERAFARYESLGAQRFVPEAQVEQKRDELLDQRGRLNEVLRDQASLEREVESLRQDLASAELRATHERSKLDREKAQLSQELTEHQSRRTIVITAPADGIATAVLADRGQTTGAQTLLLSILPGDGRLEAKLLVPSRSIAFIAPGDQVSLRYQAFPYQRFGTFKGQVTEIPRTMVAPGEADGPVALQESAYRVTVKIEAQAVRTERSEVPLQPGMQLDADIWLERRRLVEWLFEPMLTVARRV
ncbi:HlyD family efflux transporter periplasmic adaptor subunit [Piscinibacter sp. XHJ-5]|uniref:HlyD family secretion protein n=1 Tax=Piscinibacter sp. XHJ-5 TaxID=3037797 RepID=UPI0024530B0B|nr:HlyD family efflux transporter periplasmic adaptor subunit [Piscinibacter sp. XHJ-5]